jgi:hypothetical protein
MAKFRRKDEEVGRVFMEKWKSFLSKTKTALKELPAEIIDKVQVYDRESLTNLNFLE